jgi:hypothetical protein
LIKFYNGRDNTSYSFNSANKGTWNYGLKDYLLIQTLLESSFPDQLMAFNIFTRQNLLENLCNYYQLIECEDYYYSEYLRINPEARLKTGQERRIKIGWEFKDYLKK